MTADTIFDAASLTKVVATTPAIMRLYEQGKLDLDARFRATARLLCHEILFANF